MGTFDTKLVARDIVAADTMVFEFEQPVGFAFKAGQSIDLILIDTEVEAARGARHTFSIVSAPFEDRLAIATRMRDSAFKRALKLLMVGAPARIEGPAGSLTLHQDARHAAVLIAGGIGITPFVSMIRQAANDQAPQCLLLIYSNHRPEDASFISELIQLERVNSNFRLIATMTQASKSNVHWNGHSGRIDQALLRQVAGNLNEPIYYLAGPPGMVDAMHEALADIGVPDYTVRSESFYGY